MRDEKGRERTLKALAAETGVPERTIRYYISRGLIDRPFRSGRGAAYGDKHKSRLEAIRAFQAKGMTLADITHALAAAESGLETPSRIMGMTAVPGHPSTDRGRGPTQAHGDREPEPGKMIWFEPDGSLDESQKGLMSLARDIGKIATADTSLPESEMWRSYEIAPDVRVMLRIGAGPGRVKMLLVALRRFAGEVMG
jgi:DNA-binding transcriptional MerR regulator